MDSRDSVAATGIGKTRKSYSSAPTGGVDFDGETVWLACRHPVLRAGEPRLLLRRVCVMPTPLQVEEALFTVGESSLQGREEFNPRG